MHMIFFLIFFVVLDQVVDKFSCLAEHVLNWGRGRGRLEGGYILSMSLKMSLALVTF